MIDTKRMDVMQQALAPMSRQSKVAPSPPQTSAVIVPQSPDTAPDQSGSTAGDVVASHNTFDDWLSTFAIESSTPTRANEQESLTKF
jgi:hypothetical protein